MYMKNFGEFFADQIANASAVVLSHTENISEDKLSSAIEIVRSANDEAEIISTPYEELPIDILLSAMQKGKDNLAETLVHEHHHHDHGEHCDCHHHDHDEHCDCDCGCHDHHHADDVFSSVGGETNKKYTKEEISDFLRALESGKYGTVLRAKGYLPTDGGFIHFDYVPGEPDIREGVAMPTGRYCVIGSDLKEHEINELLRR